MMNMDNKIVFILLSFLSVAHCTDLQSTVTGVEQNSVSSNDKLSDRNEMDESNTTAAAVVNASGRSGRQYYQPSFAYQPFSMRRAYKVPVQYKKRPLRTKSGRRPGRPSSRPMSLSSAAMQTGRFRRFPPPLRVQHANFIDSAGPVDYDDGLGAMSFDYGEREFDHESAAAYVPVAAVATPGRLRKRPAAVAGYADADESPPRAIVHIPVRVTARPSPVPATTTADPMEKLKQLVHEAMDEHFSNRHQELYADGFDKQPHVYSAKYKRQPMDKDKQQQRSVDDVKSTAAVIPLAPPSSSGAKKVASHSSSAVKKDVSYADADADGSDDRLTLAEISAYMGAKPAETVLSAGGHRYVLSDALQQSYRHQQDPIYGGEDAHDLHRQQPYLRYVSPFEALYELPAVRWTYK